MTQAIVCRKDNAYHIEITGHSLYSQNGEADRVCAACSMLTGLLNQILEDEKQYINLESMTMDDGHALFDFIVLKIAVWVPIKIDVVVTGFEMLQNQYPENVCIKNLVL